MIDSADLKKFKLFAGFSDEDLEQLAAACVRLDFDPGDIVVKQGQPGDELFLIDEGEVVVVRHDDGQEFTLNTMSEGQDFGILAALDGGVRRATLRATRPSSLLRLRSGDLQKVFGDYHASGHALMLRNALGSTSEALRSVNEVSVGSLRRELAESKRRLSFGSFVAFLIGSVTLYAFLLRIAMGTFLGTVDSTFVSIGILVMCLLIYVPMMKLSGFPASTYGLTLRNWKGVLLESLAWTGVFLAAVTLIKLVLLHVVPAWKGQQLFSMYGFTRYETLGQALGLMALYAVFAPIQEFIARGAMQSSLHEFLGGKHAAFWAVVLSTLMFAQIHLHLTPGYAVAVLVPSLFWGAMYARQRSLLGVSVSHVLIGIFVAFFLGLPLMEH